MNTDTTTPTLAELADELGAVTVAADGYTPSLSLAVRFGDWDRVGSVTWYGGRWRAQSGGCAIDDQTDDQTAQQAVDLLIAHHAAQVAEADFEAEVRAEVLRRRAASS